MRTETASKSAKTKSRRDAQAGDARFRASLRVAAWLALYGKRAFETA